MSPDAKSKPRVPCGTLLIWETTWILKEGGVSKSQREGVCTKPLGHDGPHGEIEEYWAEVTGRSGD